MSDNTDRDEERRLALLAVNELLTSPKAGSALANLMAKAQEREASEDNPALSSPPERRLMMWECENCQQQFLDWSDRKDLGVTTTLCLECQLER